MGRAGRARRAAFAIREEAVSCKGKVQLSTWRLAAGLARKASEETGENITPYRCPFGSHFHIGHQPLPPVADPGS